MLTLNKFPILELCIFLLVIVFGFSATAQISIVESDMPYEDDTVRVSTGLNLDFIDYTETGEDYLWDFSQLVPINQRVDTFVHPSSLPSFYKIFAFFANLSVRSIENLPLPGFPLTDIYNFYNRESNEYKGIGIGVTIFGIPIPIFFDSPDLVYGFPMEYQDKWSSQSHFAQQIPGMGYLQMTKTHVDTVDGWGALITPYGTFEVLRLKSEVNEFDSIYMDSIDTGIPINRNYTVYQWMGKEQKIPMLQITSSLGGLVVDYLDSTRVILNEITEVPFLKNNELHVFPNPIGNTIQLQFEILEKQNVSVMLFDLQGREVAIIYEGILHQGKVNLADNLKERELAFGSYILQLRAGSRFVSRKIIYKP